MTNSLLPVLTRTRHSRSTRGRRICMVPSREWPTETPNRIAVYRGFVARTDVPTDGRLLSCCQTSNFIRRSVELPRAATGARAASGRRGRGSGEPPPPAAPIGDSHTARLTRRAGAAARHPTGAGGSLGGVGRSVGGWLFRQPARRGEHRRAARRPTARAERGAAARRVPALGGALAGAPSACAGGGTARPRRCPA